MNKKKKRKKNNTLVLFDIDINDDGENKNEIKEENDIDDNNDIPVKKEKKNLFSNEDKEKLDILFNKKDKNEFKNKKNLINIDENLTDEEKTNINNNNEINNNIKINSDNNNYKIIDDYEIFLNNLPAIKNALNSPKSSTEIKEKQEQERSEKLPSQKNTSENIIKN